jgi:hypothetical protein
MTTNSTVATEEEVLDEIADLEEYARRGKCPPRCKGYRIRVNRKTLVIHEPTPTGREILTEAGFRPAEDYTLRMKIRGGRPEKIALDQEVDLTTPGIEKFKVLPRDQTEG